MIAVIACGCLVHAAFALAAQLLEPNGLYAFTVEAHTGPEAYVLRPTRRYAHAQAHLAELLDQAGFEAGGGEDDRLGIGQLQLRDEWELHQATPPRRAPDLAD